ncbi:MAG: hypothetical protein WKG01_30865 [Kofleriaceae bacterium]
MSRTRQTVTPSAQATTSTQAVWPGKRSSVTPGRTGPVGPGKRSRTQAVRKPVRKPSAP